MANDPKTCGLSSSSSLIGSPSYSSRVTHVTSTQDKTIHACRLCEGSHSLQKCDRFIKLSYD